MGIYSLIKLFYTFTICISATSVYICLIRIITLTLLIIFYYNESMLSFYAIGLKRIFNFAKKVFIILAVYVIIVSLFIHFIGQNKPKIAADPIKKNRQEIYKVVNDK